MTNVRSTKRALLSSALALFLCFAMLLGTTFAWFTDSVKSANNIIMSGNLDIELEYWNGQEWADVKDHDDILTNDLWEPGVTEVAYFRIANAGTLALKYQLGINFDDVKKGTNVFGREFLLSDYILFGVEEGIAVDENNNNAPVEYESREAAILAVPGVQKVSAGFTKAKSMTAGQELYFSLVVYMPTTVENEANYKTSDDANDPYKYRPEINLGIDVFATQVAYEADSFDKYYDGATPWLGDVDTTWYNTTDTEFVIGTAEELAGLAELVNTGVDSFAGKTIKLASNIDLNNINWTSIGNWDNAFEGDIDGQGYTVYNLYFNDPTAEGAGLLGVAVDSTINGVNLCNVDVNGYSMVAGLVGAAYPAVITDCHVTGDINIVADWAYVAGVAGYCYYGTQVDGCSVIADDMGSITSINRNAVGGITAWLLEGDHKVTNCDVANLNLTGWTNVGGITGFVHYNNTIEDCSVKNVVLTKTRVAGNPGIGLIAGGYSYSASNAITLRNNTVDTATLNGTHIEYSTYNTLYGSEYGGSVNTNFVLDNNAISNLTNNLSVVIAATPSTVQDLINNAQAGDQIALGSGKYDTTIVMKSGITLIGDTGAIVACINLNGSENVTIKNVDFDAAGAQAAYDNSKLRSYANIFGASKGGNIGARNITIDGCTFEGKFENAGAAIAFADRSRPTGFAGDITIKNCTFNTENANYDVYGYYTGQSGMTFTIENNTFASECRGSSIYLGRLRTSEAIVVTGNTFETKAALENAVYIQGDGSYAPTLNAANNTFAD